MRLNGDRALAYGAMASGVGIVTSYPGSPGSGAVIELLALREKHDMYIEWSANEKVAIEMGIGASMAGMRALVCTKSVGMNHMVDPLMAFNLTPAHGGIVILLGDDPGAYGSQNDQDTRSLSVMLEMPMLEPSDPVEAYLMIQDAFNVSEKLQTCVILRETRSFSQYIAAFPWEVPDYQAIQRGVSRERERFVPHPKNAVLKHRQLHDRFKSIEDWCEQLAYNKLRGRGKFGIVAAGFASQKLTDIIGAQTPRNSQILKLGIHHPLPKNLIRSFQKKVTEILVLEENEPFVETQLKAILQDFGSSCKVLGRRTGHLPYGGELYRWMIQRTLEKWLPRFVPTNNFREAHEEKERPVKKDYCKGSTYPQILAQLRSAAESLQLNPFITGDPGCLVDAVQLIDSKFAMGGAVATADGFSRGDHEIPGVAVLGDSSFFHTSIPALCNAVVNGSTITIIILDNRTTATTGFQPNPGTGRSATGKEAPALRIDRIARACGVKKIIKVDPGHTDDTLRKAFTEALSSDELTLVIVRTTWRHD
jgi:indolepyruvate ferredoxin oxidoreductase alpha subunit